MAIEKFDVRAQNVRSLFNEYTFVLPRFQRRYLWDYEQLDLLWDDIEAAIQRKDADYFLGTAVLVLNNSEAEVIDGQQRLATLTMMLAAFRDELLSRGHKDDADFLHSLIVRKAIGEQSFVITLSDHDAEDFQRYVQLRPDDSDRIALGTKPKSTKPGRAPKNYVRRAFDRICGKVSDTVEELAPDVALKELQLRAKFLYESIIVAGAFVPTDEDAYIIFESVNDRGLSLSSADLVKNHIFSAAAALGKAELPATEKAWNELTTQLERVRIDRFLRHHWLSTRSVITQRRLYKAVKDGFKESKSKPSAFAIELRDSAKTYTTLVAPPGGGQVDTIIRLLNELGIAQHLPFLMAAKDRLDEKGFALALQMVEAIYVKYLLIGEENPNVLETNYSSWAKALRNGTSINDVRSDAKAWLEKSIDETQSFTGVELSKTGQARYLFKRLNDGKHGQKELDWSRVTVEHILPQNPGSAWLGSSGVEQENLVDFIQRVGNLTLLDKGLNSSASNNAFKDKKEVYKHSEFGLTKDLLGASKWTLDEIVAREEELSELIDTLWSL